MSVLVVIIKAIVWKIGEKNPHS